MLRPAHDRRPRFRRGQPAGPGGRCRKRNEEGQRRLDGAESENVEDRRGQGGGFRGGLGGGGGFRIPGGRVGGGLGTIAILLNALREA